MNYAVAQWRVAYYALCAVYYAHGIQTAVFASLVAQDKGYIESSFILYG